MMGSWSSHGRWCLMRLALDPPPLPFREHAILAVYRQRVSGITKAMSVAMPQ
jgi:hypothetical protein